METWLFFVLFISATILPLLSLPWLFFSTCRLIGTTLQTRSELKRKQLFEQAQKQEDARKIRDTRLTEQEVTSPTDQEWEKVDSTQFSKSSPSSILSPSEKPLQKPTESEKKEWQGIIGFLHPFCNAGGGGERVLWAAIRSTQQLYPKALCVVYTGDVEIQKTKMLLNVSTRFNIQLNPSRIVFLYLSSRKHVLAENWPRFTLLGQSLGSLLMAWDAFNLLVPDILIDTMGYAFALSFSKVLFPNVPTGAYVHYPTISTDMLSSLSFKTHDQRGIHVGKSPFIVICKKIYWLMFAWMYTRAGSSISVAMTNSSWTQGHIIKLWDRARRRRNRSCRDISVLFPPVAVEDLTKVIPLVKEELRDPNLLYISQFRPEKNHALIIKSFARFVKDNPGLTVKGRDGKLKKPVLKLIGSVRDDVDKKLVTTLEDLCREMGIESRVEFIVNADWTVMLDILKRASIGVNGMWNEHFGIGVVEYQAAGLICVVNNSGGPKEDIVIEGTGWWANDEEEYARAFKNALMTNEEEMWKMRQAARKNSKRFGEREFENGWAKEMNALVDISDRIKQIE